MVWWWAFELAGFAAPTPRAPVVVAVAVVLVIVVVGEGVEMMVGRVGVVASLAREVGEKRPSCCCCCWYW